ncbi:MAG: hypothetical protein IKK38_03310 [Spirochaetaceae bacterium]|nr:hypothetical protein [Spirochaetaceae bacterium]
MKKTIGILILAVILVFSLTSCGGSGGGSGISSVINKITGKDDKANKDNFAGKNFTDNGMWSTGQTMFLFGAEGSGTVTVYLEGSSTGQPCTYNKPVGNSNVNLIIKNASNTEIFNQSCTFGDNGSFQTKKKTDNTTITFNKY